MVPAVWEFQSFLSKFIQLSENGILSSLTFNNSEGAVCVNLNSTFPRCVPTPAATSFSSTQMKYEKPSKVRRRQRRRSARINKRVTDVQMKIHDTQYHTDEMRDEIINSSPDAKPTFNVLVQEDGHDFENLAATPQRSEDTYTAFEYFDVEFGDGISAVLTDLTLSKRTKDEFEDETHQKDFPKVLDPDAETQLDDSQDRSQNNLLDQPLSDVDDLDKPISKLSRTEFSLFMDECKKILMGKPAPS